MKMKFSRSLINQTIHANNFLQKRVPPPHPGVVPYSTAHIPFEKSLIEQSKLQSKFKMLDEIQRQQVTEIENLQKRICDLEASHTRLTLQLKKIEEIKDKNETQICFIFIILGYLAVNIAQLHKRHR